MSDQPISPLAAVTEPIVAILKRIRRMNKNQKDASLAEELPYWDFIDGPLAHAILFDGSIVGGLEGQSHRHRVFRRKLRQIISRWVCVPL
jgi:hypothetical protein